MENPRVPLAPEDRRGAERLVHATIRVLLPAKKRKEARVILESLIEQTKLEPGCLGCRLYQDVLEERALMIEALWASEKDHHRHLRSDKFRTVLLVIEMAAAPPEIRFETVLTSTGMETIRNARGLDDITLI